MYHVVEAMTRWIAPILSFTADEVWENIPGEHEDMGVFTATWHEGLFDYANDDIDQSLWNTLLSIRQQTTNVLESLRKAGEIGSSLDAEITIYCDEDLLDTLDILSDELRFIMITSEATLAKLENAPEGLELRTANGDQYQYVIEANASEHAKCVRCWHHRADVGQHAEHPELCGRCVDNVEGDGEQRHYA